MQHSSIQTIDIPEQTKLALDRIGEDFCRVLYYLRISVVSSKAEAGQWALAAISSTERPVIHSALNRYTQNKEIVWKTEALLSFSRYVIAEINARPRRSRGANSNSNQEPT